MTTAAVQLETLLRSNNQSITKPRQLLFDILLGSEPRTIHELIVACSPRINKASVYRTVALFERLGIVQRLQIGWKYKLELSNNFQTHHHHATCLQCGKTIPLPEDPVLEERLNQLATRLNFTPNDHQLEIRGGCESCTNQAAST